MKKSSSCDTTCKCTSSFPSINRRSFIKTAGAAAIALTKPWEAMAGPFTRKDFEKLVPADKKLRPEWIKSLFERGSRTVYEGADLEKIGMPVGGICCGQVYLGGDGTLWHWDIFNRRIGTGAEHYAKPMKKNSPFAQGFALQYQLDGQKVIKPLDQSHWSQLSFIGEYPIGYVEYRDKQCPLSIALEAFSPFIPLNVEDSSLPVTVMQFTIRNNSNSEIEAGLGGWLENAICLHSAPNHHGLRRNRLVKRSGMLFLDCSAEQTPEDTTQMRPDIVFDDFEHASYENWKSSGTAFGSGPVEIEKIPEYQGNVNGKGKRVVNSHASAPGNDVGTKDDATGTLTSPSFTIERKYITFMIGGGSHRGTTCVNLIVNGHVMMSETGANNNQMKPVSWDVQAFAGKTAIIEVIDNQKGSWGNIGIDDIIFSDRPRVPTGPLSEEPDFGTMGLALLQTSATDFGFTSINAQNISELIFSSSNENSTQPATKPLVDKLVGGLVRPLKLAPGQSQTVTFLVLWHMPRLKIDRLPPGRAYGVRFPNAMMVGDYVAANFERLSSQTHLWHDNWYASTLPYWFLDRTFLNTSILATSTCYRFGNGRFYGWEGVGCCEGTCGHVWQYAHAMARLFPELERITREQVDFGLAMQKNGAIHFRGEFNNIPAIDAQAGTVLRALREHQMSKDSSFLTKNWMQIKKALDWLIAKDENADGLIESNQHNTLDTDWFGPVAWLSGLYQAALLAGEQMAKEMNDGSYAARCHDIATKGRLVMIEQLFEDGYFINKPDKKRLDAINSGTGCHIDQVMGQSWAFQVALPRVFPEKETLSALQALWQYNFTPDVGPYRQTYKPGRWYAMPGEAGLLMCTFPRSDWDYAQAKGKGPEWAAGYFNECMNGFEYQVASHMIWEGMLMEGLAITRAVHDRYHASRRNPWNEVECGDHYARSMASYGIFLAACGHEYHGPQGRLAFAPRLTPENFKCPFTSAEGWGTFSQSIQNGSQQAMIHIKYGVLSLNSLVLQAEKTVKHNSVAAKLSGKLIPCKLTQSGRQVSLIFNESIKISAGEILDVVLT